MADRIQQLLFSVGVAILAMFLWHPINKQIDILWDMNPVAYVAMYVLAFSLSGILCFIGIEWIVGKIKEGVVDMPVVFMVLLLIISVALAFEMRRLAAEKSALLAEVVSLRAECSAITVLRVESEKSQKENDDYKTEMNELRLTCDSLRAEFESARDANNVIQEENKKLKNEVYLAARPKYPTLPSVKSGGGK